MNSKILGLLAVALIGVSGQALATATLVGTTTNASGIDGVVVNSVTYDVTFSTSSFDSTFTGSPDEKAAASSLAAALNALAVTGLSYGQATGYACQTIGTTESCDLYAGSSFVTYDFPGSGGWQAPSAFGELLGCVNGFGHCAEAATWTVVPPSVPEPATLSLLGVGLAGIGFMRRRKAT